MLIGRMLGTVIFMLGLVCGGLILRGAASGSYVFGLIRTWVGFGAMCASGLILTSMSSGLSGAERAARLAGAAVLGLGAVSGVALVLSRYGVFHLSDTMQPWALFAVCAVAGGTLLFGSRA